jgi:hypothetical protein
MVLFLLTPGLMLPMPKTWLALLLVLPGGFVVAVCLWLAFRWQQRKRPAPGTQSTGVATVPALPAERAAA